MKIKVKMSISSVRRYIFRVLKPISVALGKLHIAPHDRLIRASMISHMADAVRAGDVVVTYSVGELTNLFIDGDFKHAAMYIGMGRVVEAVGKGVRPVVFEDFCASKDRVAILRPLFCGPEECRLAAMNVTSQIGKPYDYYFEIGEISFYCAELITWAYSNALLGKNHFIKREVMGCETVLPSDFYQAKSKFELVIDCPCKL